MDKTEELKHSSEKMSVSIHNCARCGENHVVDFVPFINGPLVIGEYTISHWGMCLNNNEPVLMYFEESD